MKKKNSKHYYYKNIPTFLTNKITNTNEWFTNKYVKTSNVKYLLIKKKKTCYKYRDR